MNAPAVPMPAASEVLQRAQAARALRKLFLTLFLRGRTSRGLDKDRAPRSVSRLLAGTLIFYALFGLMALVQLQNPVQVLSTYLHAATFVFVAMFVAASSGEILFNKEEADILLHRPVAPRVLLQAKMAVLIEVSLWLAGAFNAIGFLVGTFGTAGSWRYPFAHALSITLEAVFCTSFVVLAYQLCLRWLGRERLESLLTTVQVCVAIAMVVSAQLLPRMLPRLDGVASVPAWWWAMPPTWFAAIDDALAGTGAPFSWLMGGVAIVVTLGITWLATGRLAKYYTTGLQLLTTTSSAQPGSAVLRWSRLAAVAPLRWLLRGPAERSAFVLVCAYVLRNREIKLRLYPSIAPMLVLAVLFSLPSRRNDDGLMVAFAGASTAMLPMLAVRLLRYCEHWQAADIFRIVPLPQPAALSAGLRVAVTMLMMPAVIAVLVILNVLLPARDHFMLLLPGLLLQPLCTIMACVDGKAIPLSEPTEEARAAQRGLLMIGIMMSAFLIGGLAYWAQRSGLLLEFLLVESVLVLMTYVLLHRHLARRPWSVLE